MTNFPYIKPPDGRVVKPKKTSADKLLEALIDQRIETVLRRVETQVSQLRNEIEDLGDELEDVVTERVLAAVLQDLADTFRGLAPRGPERDRYPTPKRRRRHPRKRPKRN